MNTTFSYYMPVNISFGAGMSKNLAGKVVGSKVLMVCDPFLFQSGTAQAIAAALAPAQVEFFTGVEPNPSCESVDAAAAQARALQADCVIGLGGGSALDVSKIVACLNDCEGSIYDYYAGGGKVLPPRKTQLICIPTTAGTGSEVTNVGVYTNKKAGVKMPMVTRQFWCDIAVIDPELTYTMPPSVTASTGMDAFCHAIEAYWNTGAQPIADQLAIAAMKAVLEHLETAYREPSNPAAREKMMEASLLAGIAFSQTRTTGIHALSFPLTTEFGASHGVACAITLPAFIRLCGTHSPAKLTALALALGCGDVEALALRVEQVMTQVKMPIRLSAIGVKSTDIPHLAQVGLTAGIIHLTPAPMNTEAVEALLHSIL